MKLDEQMVSLICDLEYCIGSECYNPNSYDGWTGESGCSFRYPVYYSTSKTSGQYKERYRISSFLSNYDEYIVKSMKYKFGSNHLFVGLGIKNVLETLEEYYDLDFNELEQKRREREQSEEQ